MHILILSANTGEGHNSAARALKEYFEARGDRCTVRDGLYYMGPSRDIFISKSHVFFYRKMPKVYGMGYRFEEKQAHRQRYQQKLRERTRRQHHLSKSKRKLRALLQSGDYDAVISVHVFAARLVSELRRSEGVRLPSFFLATDYTCSPGVNQLDVDAWLIPHPALIPEFARYGIPEERLIPAGIPVRAAFLHRGDKLAARRALELPEDRHIALFSCGSMGAGPMERAVRALLGKLPEDALLVTVCGNNQSLERSLSDLDAPDKLRVLGFTDRMDDYMDAADLFLTKAGGLSITEAVHKRVPLLLINAVPGVESRNLEFIESLGCALTANNLSSIAAVAATAMESPETLKSLSDSCEREFFTNPAGHIHEILRSRMP